MNDAHILHLKQWVLPLEPQSPRSATGSATDFLKRSILRETACMNDVNSVNGEKSSISTQRRMETCNVSAGATTVDIHAPHRNGVGKKVGLSMSIQTEKVDLRANMMEKRRAMQENRNYETVQAYYRAFEAYYSLPSEVEVCVGCGTGFDFRGGEQLCPKCYNT